VYEVVLAHELQERGLELERQVPVPAHYRGIVFDIAFRIDILVAGKVVIEVKSVEQIHQAHRKQLQTYLRLTGHKLGFLLTFGDALMKRGIREQLTVFRMTEPFAPWRLGARTILNLGELHGW
jgi:GxxExxY protein